MLKHQLLNAAASVLAAIAFAGFTASAANAQSGPLKVGFSSPLTGPLAGVGELAQKGLYAAVDAVNKNGGVLGRQLSVIVRDDQGDPNKSLAAVKELVSRENVDVYISGTTSGAALATSAFLNENNVVSMLGFPTNAKLFDVSSYPYNFAQGPTSDIGGAALGDLAIRLGAKRVALAKENQAFGAGQVDGAGAYLKAKGVEPVAVVEFPHDGPDLTSYVLRLRNESPDLIIACTQAPAFARLFQAIKRLNVTTRVLGCLGIATPQFLELATDNVPDGTMSSFMKAPPWRTDIPNVKTYLDNFKAKWNAEPTSTSEAQVYDSVVIWAEAVRRAGSADGKKVKDALESMSNFTGTATVPATYSKTDHRLFREADFVAVYLVTSDKVKGGGAFRNRSWVDADSLAKAGVPIPQVKN
jgi:branched-chain amino acid transport system substrate-binding protein